MTAPEPSGRLAQAAEFVLTVFASAVFVLLWVYVALAALTDSTLPADTWSWLSGLEPVAAVVVWIAILPLGVFLWAAQADLEPVWMGIIMLGLAGWTWLAWGGLARLAWRRARAAEG